MHAQYILRSLQTDTTQWVVFFVNLKINSTFMIRFFFIFIFVQDRNPGNFFKIREKIILNSLARHTQPLVAPQRINSKILGFSERFPVLPTIPRTVNNPVKISKCRPHSTLITLFTTALPILETSESTTSRFVRRVKVVVRVVVFW